MATISVVYDILSSDKLSRRNLARGTSAHTADDVVVRNHRLLKEGYVEAEGRTMIAVKAAGPVSLEMTMAVMLPGLLSPDGEAIFNADDPLQYNPDVMTAPIEIEGLMVLPFGCKLKITNIKGSPSSDEGVNLVIIHD